MNIFKVKVYENHPIEESKIFIKTKEQSTQTELDNNISTELDNTINENIIKQSNLTNDNINVLTHKINEQNNILKYGFSLTFILLTTIIIFK